MQERKNVLTSAVIAGGIVVAAGVYAVVNRYEHAMVSLQGVNYYELRRDRWTGKQCVTFEIMPGSALRQGQAFCDPFGVDLSEFVQPKTTP